MKQLNIFTVIFFTFFSHLYAYDLSHMIDRNISQQDVNTTNRQMEKPRKRSKNLYKKFENFFSDYDDTWVENMFTYTADIMMPDEMIIATRDIMNNRLDKKFGSSKQDIPNILGTDAYSWLLTTGYYQFQDISRITDELWEDDACDPGSFTYDINKEPKEPLLDLKASDKNARGVTQNGIVLPINQNFPEALYPYAVKPNGCSAEGLQDVYDLANDFSDDEPWLKKACDNHDKCYFTEGTSSKDCNAQFIVEAVDACNHISNTDTLLFMGMKNAFCGFKGLTVSSAANACADRYFAEAQRKQKAYNQWVKRYEESYLKAKQKK